MPISGFGYITDGKCVRMVKKNFFLFLFLTLISCNQEERIIVETKIKNHQFIPNEIKVPPGKKIQLNVINLDPTIEEFESFSLNREKIVPGNGGKIKILIGPLKEGTYDFFGEFNMDSAKGSLKVFKGED